MFSSPVLKENESFPRFPHDLPALSQLLIELGMPESNHQDLLSDATDFALGCLRTDGTEDPLGNISTERVMGLADCLGLVKPVYPLLLRFHPCRRW